MVLATRLLAVAAAALLFFLFVAQGFGLGPSVDGTFRWIAFRAQRLMDTWVSLL